MNYMIPIIKSAVFNDLTVVRSDSFLSTAVGILAISFPESMGGALASGEVDVLLLPQHTHSGYKTQIFQLGPFLDPPTLKVQYFFLVQPTVKTKSVLKSSCT